jgi:hypothetical protein
LNIDTQPSDASAATALPATRVMKTAVKPNINAGPEAAFEVVFKKVFIFLILHSTPPKAKFSCLFSHLGEVRGIVILPT